MDEFFIRPGVDGARIPDPASGDVLAADGEWKPRTPHWLRLEMRGDVIAFDPHAVLGAEDPPEPEPAEQKPLRSDTPHEG